MQSDKFHVHVDLGQDRYVTVITMAHHSESTTDCQAGRHCTRYFTEDGAMICQVDTMVSPGVNIVQGNLGTVTE